MHDVFPARRETCAAPDPSSFIAKVSCMTLHTGDPADNLIFQNFSDEHSFPLPRCRWCELKPLANSRFAVQQKSPAAHSKYARMGTGQLVQGAPVAEVILDKPTLAVTSQRWLLSVHLTIQYIAGAIDVNDHARNFPDSVPHHRWQHRPPGEPDRHQGRSRPETMAADCLSII
jgi:hypothetical protein